MMLLLRFLEILLLSFFAIYLGVANVLQVYHEYVGPYMSRLEFNDEKSINESTYYERTCLPPDMSTDDPQDLFLDDNSTTQEAYDVFLEHGFAVFPSVIPRGIAHNLRNFILDKNYKADPTGEEHSLLHMPYKRWLAEFHPNEDESISLAMEAVASNHLLNPTLEKLLGKNPAIVEMNAITSASGAEGQTWHCDGGLNLLANSRSLAPTHVLLMQLQDTTLDMGPTQICPGTQMCSIGDVMYDYCREHGIHVTNSSGIFPGGSAVLMNTNAFHRGAAYVAPDGPHRVMFVITLAPRPLPRAESRQIMSGLSFSMHWNVFGSTMSQFGSIRYFSNLWNVLAAPGYNLIYLYIQRLANHDESGNMNERSFDYFLDEGGVWWWPSFLMGEVDPESSYWTDYFVATGEICSAYAKNVVIGLTVATLLLLLPQSALVKRQSIFRLGSTALFLELFTVGYLQSLRNSPMIRDIQNGSLGKPNFPDRDNLYQGPTTLPLASDLLIESRLGSIYLGMYNDQIQFHPGNRHWKDLVKVYQPIYQAFPSIAQELLQEFSTVIIEDGDNSSGSICQQRQGGRLLYQSPRTGNWHRLSEEDALSFAVQELKTTPFTQFLVRQLRDIDNDCVYGFRRETALCRKHAGLSRFTPKGMRLELSDAMRNANQRKDNGLRDSKPRNAWRILPKATPISLLAKTPARSIRSWRPHCDLLASHKGFLEEGDYALAQRRAGGTLSDVTILKVDQSDVYYVAEALSGKTYGISHKNVWRWEPMEPSQAVLIMDTPVNVDEVDEYGTCYMELDEQEVAESCQGLPRLPFHSGARVLAYYDGGESDENFGWYEATILEQVEEDPWFYEIEWYDGDQETVHLQRLHLFEKLHEADIVGISGTENAVIQEMEDGVCYVAESMDAEETQEVLCSYLRRWPDEERWENLEEYLYEESTAVDEDDDDHANSHEKVEKVEEWAENDIQEDNDHDGNEEDDDHQEIVDGGNYMYSKKSERHDDEFTNEDPDGRINLTTAHNPATSTSWNNKGQMASDGTIEVNQSVDGAQASMD